VLKEEMLFQRLLDEAKKKRKKNMGVGENRKARPKR